ncbi:MAG: DUF4407 domain-containing protein [Bacteroidaceae bacterium]|jgi:hypothetical protein|nr:DUF4407 domain-containing protein [Bacteroidaceae bacterium]
MKTLRNIGCFLIGWDKNILNECGEASYRQYRKLLSAICIMMILWGTIGYCFADRYINIESCALKLCVSIAFMFIVLCVERVIILTVGKAKLMSVMRVLLALCMAVLGSCIFDQIIFRNDIQQAIQEHREDVISATITKRLAIYDSDIQRITTDMDSLSKATIALNEELQKRPIIKGTNVSTQEQVVGVDENGKPQKVKTQIVNTVTLANPLAEQLKANNDQIQIYSTQLEQLRQDKKEVAEKVREEMNQRAPGFIEELEATLKVVSQSKVSLAFYIILFCFLTFLELFVLTIKMGENKCDYELIVESQLYLKKNLMEHTAQSVLVKK